MYSSINIVDIVTIITLVFVLVTIIISYVSAQKSFEYNAEYDTWFPKENDDKQVLITNIISDNICKYCGRRIDKDSGECRGCGYVI